MNQDERAIRELVERWMQASMSGDTQTVLSLIADDAIFMVPGREPFGKEVFAAASDGQRQFRLEGSSDIQEIQILGDWAYMRNLVRVAITPLSEGQTVGARAIR